MSSVRDPIFAASRVELGAGALQAGQDTADALVRASEGRVLTDDLGTLEALALGEDPRGRAVRRALEVCGLSSAESKEAP